MTLSDYPTLQAFLEHEAAGTIAVPIDDAGTLHIATMHYVHMTDPLRFYFATSSKSEKCRLLNEQPEVIAACSVGTYVGTPFTLQMRGHARLLQMADHPDIIEKYFTKRQSSNKNVEGSDSVLVEFTPNWARFTDFSKGWDTTMLDLS